MDKTVEPSVSPDSEAPISDDAPNPADMLGWRTRANLSTEDVAAKVRALGQRCTKRTYEEAERGWFRGSYELLAAIAQVSEGVLTADALRRRPLKIEATRRDAA
jgi:transcriptional regulator with XRE-family HTH domain